ncbi:hypothetical protein BC832DRAFT_554249 [Gaertneriomyces semiglobifer]|nr:hypothetical protein BC832DRAFT_554249 [Gaertneriomyces semiglobifer]
MFVYLSKKVAIPNGTRLRTIAWNNDQGWIACGGENGLLKVLKLEAPTGNVAEGQGGTVERSKDGSASVTNLSMNQTLEGHNGAVVVSTWNSQHRKLTTSDENGLIIVWILYKGMWYEEMINNRNKSVVTDMHWDKDGNKICIAYEDGAVIVGSVDGNRLWSQELKVPLTHLSWTPDGQRILFATQSGELHLYDGQGVFMSKVPVYCHDTDRTTSVTAMDWYNGSNGYDDKRAPAFAVSFDNGKIQLIRDVNDDAPIIIDTVMRQLNLRWNHNGTILAVSGVQSVRNIQGEEKEVSLVQFYDPFGQFLRSMKVPGKRITALSWESTGLRIALAVDSFIYFANIRPDYKWAFFSENILAYAYFRPERQENLMTFWNTKTNEKFVKLINKPLLITSYKEHCLVVTKSPDEEIDRYVLTVANAIGTALETKEIEFEPKFVAINKHGAFAASTDLMLYWPFRNVGSTKLLALEALRRTEVRERVFHIDAVQNAGDGPTNVEMAALLKRGPSSDPIEYITVSDTILIVARQSGQLLQFLLPSVTLENKYASPFRPKHLGLNCNSTQLAIVDASGVLNIMTIESRNVTRQPSGGLVGAGSHSSIKNTTSGALSNFERRDVWDIRWSDDDPDLFAVTEKMRMYVFRGLEPEEPISCTGYICSFDNLCIKTAVLDEILQQPLAPSKEHIMIVETKSLRDTRSILAQVGLADAFRFVEENSHSRLWKLIVDAALEQQEYAMAQSALVKLADYPGIQFVKRIQKLDDKQKQKAEIALYFGQYDVAEKLYLDMDRKDLAIELREKIGDWFRVVQLIKSGGGTDDILLERAWNHIGDYYYERQKWAQAATYYAQGRNYERLVECYYIIEDYERLEKLVFLLPDSSVLLRDIGEKFAAVGMNDQAVQAYVKAGDIKAAVDASVYINQVSLSQAMSLLLVITHGTMRGQWATAIELAQKYQIQEIQALLSQYAAGLLSENKRTEVIDLYRKANYCQKSAKLLSELAADAAKARKTPLIVKKLHVLAALEVERYHHLTKVDRGGFGVATATLDGLLAEDAKTGIDSRFLDNAWRGAEAYHFLMLAQRQFYAGDAEAAVKTTLHLREFEDLIEPKAIYSLLALVGFHSKRFGVCSKAFAKLESLPDLTPEEAEQYEDLAITIFGKYRPQDRKGCDSPCTNCGSMLQDTDTYCNECHVIYPTCIASGQPIYDSVHFMCQVCKHRAIDTEISGMSCCPLCHTPL